MKTVKVFVSSLFSEMAHERDVIHRQVNAMISERFRERFDTRVIFVDLRWGVEDRMATSEIERSSQVVNKCFEAIEDCDIFLGVLGNNYGSLAPPQIVARYVTDTPTPDRSYTELEIIHAQKYISPQNMIFVMKPPSQNDHPEMFRLKQEIIVKHQYNVYEKNVETDTVSPSFISGCVELCVKCIEGLKPKRINKTYHYRERVVNECLELAQTNSFILLSGDSGSGKTILMRTMADYYQNAQTEVLYLDVGMSENGLLSEINTYIGEEESLENALSILKAQIQNSDKKTVIFLDEADDVEIPCVYQLYRKFRSISPEKLTVFLASHTVATIDLLSDYDIRLYTVPTLGNDEITAFINTIAHIYNKDVYDEVIRHLLEAGDKFRSPFALDMFLTKIMTAESTLYQQAALGEGNYNDMIIERLNREADSFPDQYDDMVDWKIKELDRYIYPRFAEFMIELMVEYRYTVPISLAVKAFETFYSQKWSYVDYYTYKLYLRGVLEERDGRLSFVNKKIYSKILNTERQPLKGLKEAIYQALCSLDIEPVKRLTFEMELYPEKIIESLIMEHDARNFAFALDEFFTVGLLMGEPQRAQHLIDTIFNEKTGEKIGRAMAFLANAEDKSPSVSQKTDLLVYILGKIENDISDELRLELYASVMRYSVAVGTEPHAISVLSMAKGFLFDHGQFNLCLLFNTDLLLRALYGMYTISHAIDASQLARQCLSITVKVLPLSKNVPEWAPQIIQEYMHIDMQEAESVLNRLIEQLNSQEDTEDINLLSLWINLLYAAYSLQMRQKNIEKTIPVAERLYAICQKAYKIDNSSEREIYNYSLGLNAYSFVSRVQQNYEQEREALVEIYRSRCMLCSINPDLFVYIQALTNTTIQIIKNETDIGIDYTDMLATLYDRMLVYAKRGIPRIGWLFADAFSMLSSNDKALCFYLEKLQNVKSFILPVITYNQSNATNLKDLIHCYLSIFKTYCEKGTLSLDNGRLILDDLYQCAKIAAESSPNREYYELFATVYREIHTILLQNNSNKLLFEDPIYRDCQEFVKKISEKDESMAARMLGLLPLEMEILGYVYMLLNTKSKSLLQMILSRIDLDLYANILQNVAIGLDLFKECDQTEYSVPQASIQQFLMGAAFVAKEAPSSQQRAQGELYLEELKDRFSQTS